MTDTAKQASSLESDPQFFHHVKKWIETDDILKELQEKQKELKDQKKKAEEYILEAMTKTNEDMIEFAKGGTIRKSVSNTTKALKKEDLVKAINELTKNASQAETITNNIYNNRPTSQRTYLKRNRSRKKVQGDE